MSRTRGGTLTTSSVNFEVAVLQYLKQLATAEERSCSSLINRIVRDYAMRQGTPITLAPDPARGAP